jgi:quercetin dioxygenase-like cupin family protein
MAEPILSRPGEGERHERSDGYRLVRVATEHISAIEIGFDESLVVEPHTHPDHADSFLVLDGEVEFTAGDETVVLGPGSFITSPPGVRHGFRSAGGRARVLNLHTPDGGFVDGIRRTTAESTPG